MNWKIRLANEQPILFPEKTNKRFIKFLVTDAFTLDGRSLASIGKLDVLVSQEKKHSKTRVSVESKSPDKLEGVIQRFAQRAFSSDLSEAELRPTSTLAWKVFGSMAIFVRASKVAIKAIVCSPRFLMAPGEHENSSYARASHLARVLWLSVPDDELLSLAKADDLSGRVVADQIERLLDDPKSERMVASFCAQW